MTNYEVWIGSLRTLVRANSKEEAEAYAKQLEEQQNEASETTTDIPA